ncbi:gag protein [Campylobacter pinnipediorum]|nr:gag protein [Campylobacter pinnipediorum]
MIKKTRYDMTISIECASKFEQLCEAYELKKSDMADLMINSFCEGNLVYKHYLQNLRVKKQAIKQKAIKDLSLFEDLN